MKLELNDITENELRELRNLMQDTSHSNCLLRLAKRMVSNIEENCPPSSFKSKRIKDIHIDAMNFYVEYEQLLKSRKYSIKLFDIIDVNYTLQWGGITDYNPLMLINDALMCNEVKDFFSGVDIRARSLNYLWDNKPFEYIKFADQIKSFIDEVEEYGKANFNNENWFFDTYIPNVEKSTNNDLSHVDHHPHD